MELLTFGKGNAKLGKKVFTFSLPAGWTCPNALDCLAKSDEKTGKITDGKKMRFRCFAASAEAIYPAVRKSRWKNFRLLKEAENMAKLIQSSLPKKAEIIRIHVSGDFFNADYFRAWLHVATNNPNVKFYFYTKMVLLVKKYRQFFPDNFIYTVSRGGKQDNLIMGLREAVVVFSEKEASDKKLEIDHDDSHAMTQGQSFALLIHGIQPAGSEASKAKIALKGKGSYSRKIPLTVVPSDDKIEAKGGN